jgi:hypothetical protein
METAQYKRAQQPFKLDEDRLVLQQVASSSI